ncbi:lipopolysaccharide biosynthesis protein [Salinicoccus roseus]|uniref:lipopolysaccharide biosynthesis protein n=1 Tax=Salinicoccus roseus TaxID=45670 RepID=UPI002300CDDA|nr:oligosaccharide flippase family protein [Salinicoccus roseus]
MRQKLKELTQKPFVRNVMVMATGTVAAQVVTLLLSPIITRLYGPEAYGLMGVFLAIVTVVTPIATLTYPIAIVLPKSDISAKRLICLSLFIALIMSIVVSFLLLFFNQSIIKIFQIEEIGPFIYLIPLVIIFSAFLQVAEQWLIRTNQFKVTAKVVFMQAVILQGSKVGIGLFYPFASVLIFISAIGIGLRAWMMIFFSDKTALKLSNSHEPEVSYISLAKNHIDFPLYRAPQALVSAVSQSLPILLLSTFFGPASAGLYSIGRNVLSLPTQVIGRAIGNVFYPRINEAANSNENLSKIISKVTIILILLGILPFGSIIAFGPSLFSFIFGDEWMKAGDYARWISLWSFTVFIYQPCIKALPVLRAQAFHLYFTVLTLIIQVIFLGVGYYIFKSDLIAIAMLGISSAGINITLILMTLKKSREFDHSKIN